MANLFETRPPEDTDGDPGDHFYDLTGLPDQKVDHYAKAGETWELVGRLGPGEVLRGTINPGPETGNQGNLYHNAAALEVLGPKEGGTWPPAIKVKLANKIQEDEERRAREYRDRERRLAPRMRTWRIYDGFL